MRPTKTQISLCIRAVWSLSSLSPRRNFVSLAIQNADSEDSDQTARMECANAQSYLNHRWAHMFEGAFSAVEAQFILLFVIGASHKWTEAHVNSKVTDKSCSYFIGYLTFV